MASYLVETYLPAMQARDARAAGKRARAAARKLARRGIHVRYVRTTLIPGDETCFHVFEASSHDEVAQACRIAGLDSPRIVPAIECAVEDQG
jgi:muconolactone delta-isomerase